MKKFFPLLACLASATPTSSFASADFGRPDTLQPYVGANLGRVEVDSDGFDGDSDTAYSLFIGLDIGRMFGAEFGYVDFGGAENEFFSTNTDGFQFSGLMHFFNTERFNVYVRGGVLLWDAQLNSDIGGFSNDGEEFFWALGTDIYLVENGALRLEYARYNIELEGDEVSPLAQGEEFDLNQLSVGVKYSF